jgi:hypothetical protein
MSPGAGALGVALLLACGQQSNQVIETGAAPIASGEVVTTEATVRLLPVEGGCWVLSTATGRYQPVNLPDAYKSDGKAVRVVMRGATDMMSVCQVGPLVHVDSISAR